MTFMFELDPDILEMYLRTKMNIPGQCIQNLEPKQDRHTFCSCECDLHLHLDPMTFVYELDVDIHTIALHMKNEISRSGLLKEITDTQMHLKTLPCHICKK